MMLASFREKGRLDAAYATIIDDYFSDMTDDARRRFHARANANTSITIF